MDVKITSTGKVFYQVDNAIAAMLMEAFPASFERVNPRPTPKPADLIPSWGISTNLSGYHYVVFRLGAETANYDGPPSQLVAYFAKTGVVVPDHIVKRYTPLWRPREYEHPSMAAANAAEYAAIHKGESK